MILSRRFIKNGENSGFSLLEVVIALGIMTVVSVSVISLIAEQSKQIKNMSQKIVINDLKNSLISTLQNGAACAKNLDFSVDANLKFDSTIAGKKSISLARIRVGPAAGSVVLTEVGREIIPASQLYTESILLDDLKDIGNGRWAGAWTVKIRNEFSEFVFKPIVLTAQSFDVDVTIPTAAKIIGCYGFTNSTSHSISDLSSATNSNSIDSLNFDQIWDWSRATMQTPVSISANSLTTGSILKLSTSSNLLNSSSGLLNVSNTGSGTAGILARLQSNANVNSGVTVLSSGNVGIGTNAPRNTLDVDGVISGKPAVNAVGGTVDFSKGNIQYTSSDCGSFQLLNIKDGTSYTFIVQGGSAATCSFTAFSGAGGSPALTIHMPSDHGPTMAGKHTIYSFIAAGSHVYFAWLPGM